MMNRRDFLFSAGVAVILPAKAQAAYEATVYEWGSGAALRESGQTLIWNFRSSWSLTCQIKEEILAELKQANPVYRQLTFIDVDFDTYGPSQWVERMGIRRRSTLVATKYDREIARVVNEPVKERLQSLLDQALAA